MRRWKRRLFLGVLLAGLAALAIPAWVAQALRGARSLVARRAPMLKPLVIAAIAAALAVAAGGTLATASSTQAPVSLSLVAVDLPKTERFVDAGAKGDSPGDTIFFRETLLRNGRKAGTSAVMCVFVSQNEGRCHGTLRLGSGTLEASGGARFGGRFSLPVVGGTGTYAGAAGVLTVIAVSEKRSRYAISLEG
jgi:hypothetical protein